MEYINNSALALLFIVSNIILSSCNHEVKQNEGTYSHVILTDSLIKTKSQRLFHQEYEFIEGTVLEQITNITHIGDGYYFLRQPFRTDYIGCIVQMADNRKVSDIVRIGNGPFELIDLTGMVKHGDSIYFCDIMSRRILTTPLETISNQQVISSHNSREYKCTPSFYFPEIIITNDRWITQNNDFDHPDSQFVNLKPFVLNAVGYFGSYPNYYDQSIKKDPKNRMLGNRANIAIMPEGTMFGLGYYYSDRIELFDSFGKQQVSIIGPDFYDPIISEKSFYRRDPVRVKGKTVLAYSELVINSEGVFAGYCNRMEPERTLAPNEDLGKDISPGYFTQIFLFNIRGNLIRVYELDEPIFAFEVDIVNRTIYGLTSYIDSGIVKFMYN